MNIVNLIRPKRYKDGQLVLDAPDEPTRLQIILWALLLIVTTGLSLLNYQSYQTGAHYDDARYIILAESLIQHGEYGMINEAGEPGATQYPFGYPLIISPLRGAFPESFEPIKILSLIAILVNGSLLFWGWSWFSSRSRWWSLAIAGLHLLAPMGVIFTRRVMSEPLFITFCLVSLLLVEQVVWLKDRTWRLLIGLGIALFFALFIRSIGITLVFSVFLYIFLARGIRSWKMILIVGLTMLVLISMVVAITPVDIENLIPAVYLDTVEQYLGIRLGGEQEPPLSAAQPTVVKDPETKDAGVVIIVRDMVEGSIWHINNHLIPTIFPLGGGERARAFSERLGIPFLMNLISYLSFGLIVFGFLRWLVLEGLTSFLLFPLFYIGLLTFWGWEDPRFLYPIQPQLFFGLLLGIEGVLSTLIKQIKTPLVLNRLLRATPALIVVVLLGLSFFKDLNPEDSREHVGDIALRTAWINQNIPASAIIMSEAPEIDYIYSKRQNVRFLLPDSDEELLEYIRMKNVDYVLLAPEVLWYPEFTTQYSYWSSVATRWLDGMVTEGKVSLVHYSEADQIRVYEVLP